MNSAPKLISSELHSRTYRQSVRNALAIFNPSTCAAIKKYFPEKKDASDFLKTWSTFTELSLILKSNWIRGIFWNFVLANEGNSIFFVSLQTGLENEIAKNCEKLLPNCEKFILLKRVMRSSEHFGVTHRWWKMCFKIMALLFLLDPDAILCRKYSGSIGKWVEEKASFLQRMFCTHKKKIKSLVYKGVTIYERVKMKEDFTQDVQFFSNFESK